VKITCVWLDERCEASGEGDKQGALPALPGGAELHCWKKTVGGRGRAACGQSRASGLTVYTWHLMLGSSPA